jgi:hypothetical protein
VERRNSALQSLAEPSQSQEKSTGPILGTVVYQLSSEDCQSYFISLLRAFLISSGSVGRRILQSISANALLETTHQEALFTLDFLKTKYLNGIWREMKFKEYLRCLRSL